MYYLAVVLFFVSSALPFTAHSFTPDLVPESIGSDPVLTRTEELRTWTPDTMYEHVNGEAELLIRYGAKGLGFAAYENESGEYVSVDILDLGEPINAYGLYRLYAGCDGDETVVHGVVLLADDYTQYGFYGHYFLRINLDTSDNTDRRALLEDFLIHFTGTVPEPSPLPAPLEILQQNAARPCEVNYHPEHIDYDLETGPGYSWVGPDGDSYAAVLVDSEEHARQRFEALRGKGITTLLHDGRGLLWNKAEAGEPTDYMKRTIRELVDH